MSKQSRFACLLPHVAPPPGDARTLLYALRRMAVHGLKDAHASHALLAAYGLHARRPTILLRALLVEIARAASGTVIVAPCCAPRMTENEAAILRALACPETAAGEIATLVGDGAPDAAAITAATLAKGLAEIGRPLTL